MKSAKIGPRAMRAGEFRQVGCHGSQDKGTMGKNLNRALQANSYLREPADLVAARADLDRRIAEMGITLSSTELGPTLTRSAATNMVKMEESLVQQGWKAGMDVAIATDTVNTASDELVKVINTIATVLITTASLPHEFAAQQLIQTLKRLEQPNRSCSQVLRDAAWEYQKVFKQNAPLLMRLVPNDVFPDRVKLAVKMAVALSNAIDALYEGIDGKPPDSGDELRRVMTEYGETGFRNMQEDANSRPIKLSKQGRKPGPTAKVEYVLRRTQYFRHVHGGTAGEQFVKLMEELDDRADVRQWKAEVKTYEETPANKRRPVDNPWPTVKTRSIEVQVFAEYGTLNQQEGGEKLCEMRDNHPDFVKALTP